MGKNRLRIAGLLALSALVTSCGLFGGGDGSKSPTPKPSSTKPTSTASGPRDLNNPFAQKAFDVGGEQGEALTLAVKVYGVYRQGDYAVLEFGIGVPSGNAQGGRLYSYLRRAHPLPGDGDMSAFAANGITLVDSTQKKAYLTATDAPSGGDCVCAEEVLASKGTTVVGTATFKAPPAGTKTIDASLARMGYFPDVPVSDGKPPAVEKTTPQPGSTLPPFIPMKQDSDGPPAQADVVDLDTPSANLDLSVTQQKDRVTLAGDVLFEFNKATLQSDAKPRLLETAKILRKNAKGQVKVNGYTDSKGSDSYNLKLSKARADTVKKALEPLLKGTGITLVPKGYGEASPVAPNTKQGKDNPGGRKLNRRVEIVFTK